MKALDWALAVGVVHVLLQCVDSLSCEEIVSRSALSQSTLNDIDNDLQIAVDCFVNESKPLFLEPRLTIYPNASITLRKPITIKSQAAGVLRPTLTCPPDGGPVFEIRSSGILLENLRLSGCSTRSPTSSAVLIDIPGRRHSRQPGVGPPDVALESISFAANVNSKGPGAVYVRSAAELSFRRVHFNRNRGKDGGALQLDSPGVTVEFLECKFEGNEASGSGGAIHSNSPATVSIASSLLTSNIAGLDGGAIFVKEGHSTLNSSQTNFKLNMALDGSGGAMKFEGSYVSVLIKDSTLMSCEASSSGGAISITAANSVVEIVDVLFEGNKGTDGGALHAKENPLNRNKSKYHFVKFGLSHQDISPKFPPCYSFQSASRKIKVACEKVDFEGNLAHSSQEEEYNTKGGAIFLEGFGVHFSIVGWRLNNFIGNIAHEGGAIRAIDTGRVDISNSSFIENSAMSGGGVHVSFTDKSSEQTLTIQRTFFEKNVAYMGGGIMADAEIAGQSFVPDDGLASSLFHVSMGLTEPQLIMRTVYMIDHEVVKDGGALLLSDIVATCEDCFFAGNKVNENYLGAGGAVALFRFASIDVTSGWFQNNQAVSGGGVFVGNSLLKGTNMTFEGNVAFDKGGGVAVEAGRQLVFQMGDVLVDIKDSTITNNQAKIGGGVHSNILVGPEFVGCVRASIGVQSLSIFDHGINSILANVARACSVSGQAEIKKSGLALRLIDTTVTKNHAGRAGGGMFINEPQTACLCCEGKCSESCPRDVDTATKTLLEVCSKSWEANMVDGGGYGPHFATIGFGAGVTFTRGMDRLEVSNEMILRGHTSGFPLPQFIVKIVDSFDQVVTTTASPEGFVRVNSKAGVLSGQVDTLIHGGIAQFNATILSGRPTNYDLFLTFPETPNLGRIDFRVNVRECVRGEHANIGEYNTDFRCFSCPNETYSFDPNANCELCPGNAQCNGLTIAPNDGYWHFDSWSSKIEKCLSPVACTYSGREKRLQDESERANGPLRHNQNYGLCREGYQGILCGSCQDGFGRGRGFECTKCFTRGKSILLLAMGLVWAMAVISVVVKGALKAGEPLGCPFHHEPLKACNDSFGHSEGCASIHEPAGVVTEGPSQLLENTARGLNLECGENIGAISRRKTMVCLGVNAATENAKILINFLQVTSIALAINVNWRTEARKALEALDFASGVSSSGGFFSLDCPMIRDAASPISVRRSIIALTLPLGLLILATSFWIIVALLEHKPPSYFRRHAFTSALVVSFFFYASVTKRVFRILHRATVHVGADGDGVGYWADDTDLLYFKGSHAYLAWLFAVPALLMFSLGFPLALFVTLWRHKAAINDVDFARRYGFLYRAYRQEHVYWEIIITMRKASLVAVVVFALPLGGNLQGLFSLMILVASLIVHLLCQPYRQELSQMNQRETLSLCGSVFTYMVGLAFNDVNLPVWAKFAFSIAMLLLILGVVVSLSFGMVLEGLGHLDELLLKLGLQTEDMTAFGKITLFAQFYWEKGLDLFANFVNGFVLKVNEAKGDGQASIENGKSSKDIEIEMGNSTV